MATILKPPTPLPATLAQPSVFLAGSIEMGRASQWQQTVEATLEPYAVMILNPRRADWDPTWEHSIAHPQFVAQVRWELDAQERADLIAMYFAPDTSAPITLLELGLFAATGKLLVCCPAGYWRKGNVDIVCARYGIPQLPTFPELCAALVAWCDQQGLATGD